MTWMIWDMAAVLVITCSIYICARRGLVFTLITLCAYVAGVILARRLSPTIATYLYDNAVGDILHDWMQRSMSYALSRQDSGAADALPQWLQMAFLLLGGAGMQTNMDTLADTVIETTLQDPVLWILQSVSFVVVFWVVSFVLRRISYLFSGLYRVPIIGPVNTFLGGVVGAAQAVVLLALLALLLGMVLLLSSNQISWLSREVIENTYVMRIFFNLVFPY